MPWEVPATTWTPTPVSQLPSWAGAQRVAIDIETCDPFLRCAPGQKNGLGAGPLRPGGFIAGVAFAIEDGPSHYVPLRHEGGGNVPLEEGERYLADQLGSFEGEIAGFNLSYDLRWLWTKGFLTPRVRRFRDASLSAPLLDELQQKYTLDAVAEREGLPGKDEELLRRAAKAYGENAKEILWRLPSGFVGPYGEQDVRLPLQILRRHERRLEEENLWRIWELESRLLPALVRMSCRGVGVSVDRVLEIARWTIEVEEEEFAKVHHLTGVRLRAGASVTDSGHAFEAKALERALVAAGLPVTRTATGKPAVNKATLASKHPVAQAIARVRAVSKLRTTYCKAILDHEVNGRIHCTFNQLRKSKDSDSDDEGGDEEEGENEGGRFGRISASKPSLQNQPVRSKEFGKRWRAIYVAAAGRHWAKLDFSQQEPRWMVDYATRLGLPGAEEMARRYNEDPKTDFHNMTSAASGLSRDDAKPLGLGIAYGMGEGKLCRSIGRPTVKKQRRDGQWYDAAGPEGLAVLERFNAGLPWLKRLAVAAQDRARKQKFVLTFLGRRCRFPLDEHGNPDWIHKALNRVIQGSAADQTKSAVVAMDEAGLEPELQVHDEIDMQYDDVRTVIRAKEIMETVVTSVVRHRAEAELGDDWGSAKKIDDVDLYKMTA